MQTQITKTAVLFENSCEICGHIKICAVFRAVGPLLTNNWEDNERPIDPKDLAKICRDFLSASTVDMIREAQ